MNTMNRCLLSSLVAAPLLAAAMTCVAQTTLPQVQTAVTAPKVGQRPFPSHAQFGILRIDHVPNAQINGQAVRTAPGFRLFSADNKLIFAHTVQSQELKVAYVLEASTQWLLTAWILTPEELASFKAKR
jgi:hypothetical protein